MNRVGAPSALTATKCRAESSWPLYIDTDRVAPAEQVRETRRLSRSCQLTGARREAESPVQRRRGRRRCRHRVTAVIRTSNWVPTATEWYGGVAVWHQPLSLRTSHLSALWMLPVVVSPHVVADLRDWLPDSPVRFTCPSRRRWRRFAVDVDVIVQLVSYQVSELLYSLSCCGTAHSYY